MGWRTAKAIMPSSGRTAWLLVDESFEPHREVREYVLSMLARDLATQTIRAYVPRIGRWLNWCEGSGVAWREVRLSDLTRFKFFIEQSPDRRGRLRSGKSVNAILVSVMSFLRFSASHGFVDRERVAALEERRFLRFAPPGYNRGEDGQFSVARSPILRAAEVQRPPALLTGAQPQALVDAALMSRDRFLIVLLLESGLRIGEAIGMRREDLHLLPSSQSLGCSVVGAHVHVRPRQNANGARVKSGRPRMIPVTDKLVETYRKYCLDRDHEETASSSDYLFVNLHGRWRGRPMSYSNAKQLVEAAGRRAGFRARPHMLRHTAATRWLRSGTPPDVVQALLGHASAVSTQVEAPQVWCRSCLSPGG